MTGGADPQGGHSSPMGAGGAGGAGGLGGAQVPAGLPGVKGAESAQKRAIGLINRRDYRGCLALLKDQPPEVFMATHVVEDVLLKILKVIHLRHKTNREFAAEVDPHEQCIMGLMRSVLHAKSLDVEINRSLDKYHSLVDYVSRARHGHEPMLEDPEFWPWLDGNYPNVSEFLRADSCFIGKTNSLVQMLSVKFKSRTAPHARAYMGAVDGLCRQVTEICAGRACGYAKKASESWISARTEMAVLVALSGNFRILRIDPGIPCSGNLADISFEHEGVEHYVEVYSHSDYEMVAAETRVGIRQRCEWKTRFQKAQIKSLKKAKVPTVYVMNLNDFQAQPGATQTRAFCEAACKMMPKDSDIVVILHGVEVASLRGGRVVEPSGLAKRLGKAIWGALPENVSRLGL